MRVEANRWSPELIEWWTALRAIPQTLRTVQRWKASDYPPTEEHGYHQHSVPTLVVCVHGSARISSSARTGSRAHSGSDSARVDLLAGDALILQPGAWHRHETIRKGALVFQQGFLRGRADFWFANHERMLMASVPEFPSRRTLETACATRDATERCRILREHITNITNEVAEPLRPIPPAVSLMEEVLWSLVSRPGSADDIIRASGVGRAQAYRLFTQHLGQTPAVALLTMRLDLAERLLAEGLAIYEVAERCGFTSRVVFSRAFHRERGYAPGSPGRRPRTAQDLSQ